MKKITLLLAGLCFSVVINAQTIVNTGVGDKHVVVEEFTGVKCSNCPAGHTTLSNIITANSGLVHAVAFVPTNSSYTNPSGTSATDFRRSFADAYYSSAYCSPGNGSRFMPSAFINRKVLTSGNILQNAGTWTGHINDALAETADLNVGAESTYNSVTKELTIDVEVYYLSNITSGNSLYVVITEDDLISTYQSGTSASVANPYTYKNIFRENVSAGQWGDAITGATTQGTTYSTQYVFDLDNAVDPIDVSKAHVVVYVIESSTTNKEIYNGISVAADGGLASTGTGTVGIVEEIKENTVSVFPNPTNGISTIEFNLIKNAPVKMNIYNSVGSLVSTQSSQNMVAGNHKLNFDGSDLAKGMYVLNLVIGDQVIIKKVSLQ